MRRLLTYSEALSKSQNYCALQERCIFDVDQKLQLWMISESDRRNIISYLIQENFINEARYAELFVRGKLSVKGWGPNKIAYALSIKKIDKKYIQLALATISDQSVNEKLIDLLIKKRKQLTQFDDYLTKIKLIRYALSKGYTQLQINKAIQGLEEAR